MMKINSKIISEKVDYYIDLMLESDSKEPDPNDITNGEEPKEGESQKDEIIDDIEEAFELLNDDDEDDIDSEKDLNAADGKDSDEEEDVEEGFLSGLFKGGAAAKAARIAKAKQAARAGHKVGNQMNAMGKSVR